MRSYTFKAAAGSLLLALLAAFQPAAADAASAKTAAEISVADFFKLADYRNMTISPDGKHLAGVIPIKGRGNLIVIDLATRKGNVITSSDRFDVVNVTWIGDHRLYYDVGDGQDVSGAFRAKGAYSIDIDGKNPRVIESSDQDEGIGKAELPDGGIGILDIVGGDSPEAYVEMYGRSHKYPDVYKLNFKTLRYTLVTENSPGHSNDWVLDTHDNPRFVYQDLGRPKQGSPRGEAILYRDADGNEWRKLFEQNSYRDGDSYDVLGFDNDDTTAFIATNHGRDRMAVFKFDTKTGKFGDVVAEDPYFDVEAALIHEPVTHKVIGLRYEGAKPTYVWLDQHAKQVQAQLDAALPGHFNAVVRARENPNVMLLSSDSDVDPGAYYIYDDAKKSLEQVVKKRSWINPALMAERKFIEYKARDGERQVAYLTLPRGSDGKNLPLIVNIHGGPQVRGYHWMEWGRWPEAEFFAAHGYAVLEPEPRGSMGSGRQHFVLGFKQWGRTMQDDITDGALYLVQQGIVDKNRMCLHGASYGGYATLQGLVKEPDLFKCGNAFVAVSDLELWRKVTWSDVAERTVAADSYANNEYLVWIGDPDQDKDLYQKYSPARNADKIKAPLQLSVGSDDVRVPMIHGSTMRDAMKAAGKQIDYKVYNGEGHGFNKPENVEDFYTRSLAFFDKYLKATPAATDAK